MTMCDLLTLPLTHWGLAWRIRENCDCAETVLSYGCWQKELSQFLTRLELASGAESLFIRIVKLLLNPSVIEPGLAENERKYPVAVKSVQLLTHSATFITGQRQQFLSKSIIQHAGSSLSDCVEMGSSKSLRFYSLLCEYFTAASGQSCLSEYFI